jgi:hypothetical protein
MALTLDDYGTIVEIYLIKTVLVPGEGDHQVEFGLNSETSGLTAIHAAISVPTSQKQIEQIAAREGCRCVCCDRDGFFDVIELWVENRLMLALLTPEMACKYLGFMKPVNLEQFIGTSSEAIAV